MIVMRLCGGLGNQLFQYAAGRRLALARQTELVFDLGWYLRTPSSDTPRAYELDNYPITARLTTAVEATWCRLHQGRLARLPSYFPRRWAHRKESTFDFDPLVLGLPDNTYLDGYWQSYRYFEDCANVVHSELSPMAPLGLKDQEIANLIAKGGAVSVHVRRGDYVTHQAAAAYHGLCSLEYYKAAVAHMLRHVTRPHFFVFSDDVAWARDHLPLPGQATFVNHNGPRTAFQDLRLMSLCDHQIIANSSFSWWAAWLNMRPDKIVVAPQQWFADRRSVQSLIPDNWIRL